MTRMPPFSQSVIAAEQPGPVAMQGGRIRLLMLTDTSILAPGGSERFLRNLMSRLSSQHYQITVVQLTKAVQAWRDTSLPSGTQHVVMRSMPTGAVYGPRGWLAMRNLRRLMKREQFDIVQSQHEKSDLFNALLPRAMGAIRISNRRDMGFNKSSRLRLLFRFLNHRFDCIVAPAQPILSTLARVENLAAQDMLWIPNGVDAERFRPQSARLQRESRRALGLTDDVIVFGCIASLTPVKCHADLLDAFALLHRQMPYTRLLLIGDGPLRPQVARQIAALELDGVVSLLGDRPDVEALLPALDVAVLVSSTEGMSNAILEAMASGLPVIATDAGGNSQLVDHQVTGILVPVHEPMLLAEALRTLAEAPETRRRMGDAARIRVEREFSLDSMVQSFDQLYRRLLGRP